VTEQGSRSGEIHLLDEASGGVVAETVRVVSPLSLG